MSTTGRLPKNVRRRGWKAIETSQKRDAAQARQEEFDSMTLQEKLQSLIDRGHGHCKQAQKYREEIMREAEREGASVREKTRKAKKAPKKTRKSDRKKAR